MPDSYLRPDIYFLPVLAVLAVLSAVLITGTLLGRYRYDARAARLEKERQQVG